MVESVLNVASWVGASLPVASRKRQVYTLAPKHGEQFEGRSSASVAFLVIVGQGLFELLSLGGFVAGYFFDLGWLMIVGGILIVLGDVADMAMGVLNPLSPIVLAIIGVLLLTPWYLGVFSASAIFHVLNIPTSLKKVYAPRKFLTSDVSNGLF